MKNVVDEGGCERVFFYGNMYVCLGLKVSKSTIGSSVQGDAGSIVDLFGRAEQPVSCSVEYARKLDMLCF